MNRIKRIIIGALVALAITGQAFAMSIAFHDGVWFLSNPDFAGYIKIQQNGVDLYIPAYFALEAGQTPIGPRGPVRGE